MSVVCAVRLVRDCVGEVVATLGVELQAVPAAVVPELVRYQVRAHHEVALPAKAAFALLGCKPPLGVGAMQLVPVFHHGLDLAEVLERVPDHAYGADRQRHGAPNA